MSWPGTLAAVGLRDPRLEMGEKFLLVVIGSYVGPELTCFPSQARLAEDLGTTTRSVRSYLAKLEALGYIGRQKRRANGKQTSDLLTLKIQAETVSARPRFQAETDVVSGGNKRHSQAETISYELTNEPRKNNAREPRQAETPASRAQLAKDMKNLAQSLAKRIA